MKKLTVLIAALAVVAAACGTSSTTSTTSVPSATSTTSAPAPAELNGAWTLVSVALKTQMISVAEEFGAKIDFADGEFTGNGGCNSLFGSYTAAAGSITFESVGMTEIGCPGAQKLEMTFVRILTNADSYSIDNGVLIIHSGTEELALRRS
ncbi:hypothetical protein MNBD_ACTINO02-918 [hydrothermal vent metagenome]|uniref:DUF306 domain-containing protein n=1 Tax=hydrothermal vent metagenome TaxID=652676 RepID=A0A3B0TMS8_9ZZZZ